MAAPPGLSGRTQGPPEGGSRQGRGRASSVTGASRPDRRHPAPGRLSGQCTSWSATPDGWGAVGAVLGTGGTGCGHAPLAFALTQCRSASPLVWSSLIATETDCWTGMAPAMLVIALGFGTGVIARTRPQSMEWTTTTGDRLGAAHLRPAPRRRPRPRDPGERRRCSQHRAATAGASTSSSSSWATPVAWLRISSQTSGSRRQWLPATLRRRACCAVSGSSRTSVTHNQGEFAAQHVLPGGASICSVKVWGLGQAACLCPGW